MQYLQCKQNSLSNPYSYRTQIEKELLSSLPLQLSNSTHPTKVVRTASSILKLNLLQCSLLGWLLKRSQYSLYDLTLSANNINLFQQDQNKSLLLLILLNAYHVKSFLNKSTEPLIDSEVLSLIPQFSKIYKNWRPDSLLKDANLMELNQTFSKWSQPAKRSKPDYNKLVNKILDLSKTYNVAGNDQQVPKKKRKLNEDQQQIKPEQIQLFQQQPSQQQQQDKNYMNKSNSMMLRSSRMNRNNQNFANIAFDEQDQNDNAFNNNSLRRSSRLRMSKHFFFDLEPSLPNNQQFPSQPINNTIFRSTYKIQNDENIVKPTHLTNLKRTSSNDFINE